MSGRPLQVAETMPRLRTPAAGGLSWLVLAAVFVGAMDQTVVAAVLPALVRDLSIPFDHLDQAAWAVTLYLAAYAAVVPSAGRFIDAGARSATLVGGLLVFAVGSLVCALAADLGLLVAGRVVQALGAGVLLPVALAGANEGDRRRRIIRIGLVVAVAEAGAVCGPLYGAAALEWLDWRWVFWLNLPLVALIGASQARSAQPHLARLDWPALAQPLMLGLALGLLIAGLSREAASTAAWLPASCVAAAALLLVVLVTAQQRSKSCSPLASLGYTPGFVSLLGVHLCLGIALMVPLVLVPVWANTLLALDAPGAARVLLRLTLAIPPAGLVGALAAKRLGNRPVAIFSLGLVAAGLLGMAGWHAETGVAEMTPALVLAGTGFGLLLAPLTELVLGLADATSIGSASIGSAVSLATAARVVGMALGLSVLTRWGLDRLLSRLAELPSPRLTSVTALVEYQRAAAAIAADVLGTLFQAGAVCAILAGVGLLVVQRGRPIVVTEDGGGIQ